MNSCVQLRALSVGRVRVSRGNAMRTGRAASCANQRGEKVPTAARPRVSRAAFRRILPLKFHVEFYLAEEEDG